VPDGSVSDSDLPVERLADDNVQFTVYRPKEIEPAVWQPFLAFAYPAERPPDAAPTQPEPVEIVRQQAAALLRGSIEHYKQLTQDAVHAVPADGELTFVPEVDGIEFDPPRRSFRWRSTVHREEFLLCADVRIAGQIARGRLAVFLGRLLIGDVPLSISIKATAKGTANSRSTPGAALVTESAPRYRRIFASYCHRDHAIVEEIERYARILGDEYLRDVTTLRSGEVWGERLEALIDDADVFQLFWSWRSIDSPFVRQEWEHALQLGRPGFIRPVYWEDPIPRRPEHDLPPAALSQLHFQKLPFGVVADRQSASPPAIASDKRTDLHALAAVEREVFAKSLADRTRFGRVTRSGDAEREAFGKNSMEASRKPPSFKPIHPDIRRCPRGHPMAADWEECPQCKLEKGAARRTQVDGNRREPPREETQESAQVVVDGVEPVHDPHPFERGEDLQRPADMGIRDATGAVAGPERPPTRVFDPNAAPRSSRRETKVFEGIDDGKSRREPSPPARPLTGVLYTFTWSRVGQLFQIRAGRNYAGTAETTREGEVTDILLSDDTTLSGTHFLILYQAGKYSVSDCNSTNGTFVNGQQITPQGVELVDDAKILAGNTLFVFKKVRPPTAAVVAESKPKGYDPVPEGDPG
jgi:hypothetical protein